MPATRIAALFARLSSESNGNGDRVYAEAGGVHRLDLRGGLSPKQTALLRDAAGALLRGLAEGAREPGRARAAAELADRFAPTMTAPGAHLDQGRVAALVVAVFGLVNEHHPRVTFEVHAVDRYHGIGDARDGRGVSAVPVSGGGGGGGAVTKAGFKRAVMRRAGIMEDLKALALSKGIRSYTTKENLVDGILRKARVAELRRFLRDHPAPGA